MCNRTDVHVNLTCSAQEAQEYPSPSRWLFAVNGRRVFARGGNWVPADMAFGRIVREKARFRGLLAMARDLGYTYIRIWGGGLIEDQQFYDYADEFGIMLQQDFPLAGCGFSQQNASWDWLTQPIATADGESVLGAFEKQLPVALRLWPTIPQWFDTLSATSCTRTGRSARWRRCSRTRCGRSTRRG